jgi:predicted esterase
VSKGIPPQRIVLGGFSQGCALSLLTDLTSSKYAGRLAGVIGLMGYLPLAHRLLDLRAKGGLPVGHGDVPMFLVRGQRDQLIPKRIWNLTLKNLEMVGVSKDSLQVKEYEGVGHGLTGPVLRDMCSFLEQVVPSLED